MASDDERKGPELDAGRSRPSGHGYNVFLEPGALPTERLPVYPSPSEGWPMLTTRSDACGISPP